MEWFRAQILALSGEEFPAAVLGLISLLTVAVGSWALLVATLASSPGLRGLAIVLTPRILRGLLLAGVAGTLSLPAAQADDRGVDGLRLPDRPLNTGSVEPAAPIRVVQRGDTLWAIARDRLGSNPGVAIIARHVVRWHDANRAVIGSDPDLILPGQRLVPPPKDRS